ncbi:MAG TPA: polyprenol phosphomannose-dependent alpha 1,6 mannosyltransferase MptB [Actinophytocola sp.]|uniref:polyprenol phosphomannose-dependent alpha 1,6 mannosyltransferase MptB n=1 Tax=Actinophytocola sp. TaxID=1872138 RepID=UPI002DB6A653|nr:polyprenol phosphomannose-dependent alpha 1,6 mannosyltransferase MptB [Actinophytocola sp.]HEU5474685.1 polyprenol phosphomannose-dependent alpha 1,6 mannosyltransferase MptB [Actinophytocola sp.]
MGPDDGATKAEPATRQRGPLPLRTIALGTVGSLTILICALGAAGTLVHDPLLGRGPLSWVRYGHGQKLATMALFVGFLLVVWAWVRLGRHVLAERVGTRAVLIASACWTAPLVISPPLFSRDVYSYLAQGTLPLHGYDPYLLGPTVLDIEPIVQNVHSFWQTTPAPYGPLFILLAKGVVWVTGTHMIFGVVLMRVVMMLGLGLLLWSLPGLTRHLGGRLPVTLWLVVAGPMMVVHLVGGPHNDLLMIGFLAAGCLCVLNRKHVLGVVLVTMAVAVKATAAIALPFLVWVWAGHLGSTLLRGFLRAVAAAVLTFVATFAALTLVAGVDLGWVMTLGSSSRIVNWLSLPTGIGELIHTLIGIFVDVNKSWVVNIVRALGGLLLLVILVRQWWLAREGGPDAVRRAGIALLALAILSPATLPWYLTWGFVLVAGIAWQRRQLAGVVGIAVFLVLTYSPAGEDQLYQPLYLLLAVAVSVLAGVSLLRPDPLRLSIRADREEQAAPSP